MSALPTLEAALQRIESRDPVLHAFTSTRLDQARREFRASNHQGRLADLPFSLKDVWDTVGIPTTASSDRHRHRMPTTDAPVRTLFEAAGAILVGKTATSDLGLAVESQNYLSGITRNPLDLTRTSGGSSGGAAAAVADGMVAFDWGSDFGGSIRLPAAFCGVYGLRLSSETWPVVGHFPRPPASLRSMNGQGPLTRDLAAMRTLIELAAPRLATGPRRPFKPRGAVLWVPRWGGDWSTFAEEVAGPLREVAGPLREAHGLPTIERAAVIAHAMYSAHLEDFEESGDLSIREGARATLSALLLRGRWGDRRVHPRTAEILALMLFGRLTVHRSPKLAERRADALRAQVGALWDAGLFIVAPTAVRAPPKHGRSIWMPLLTGCAMPGNVVDATGLAMPWGRYPNGLPRSLQIWGPPGSELEVLDLAQKLLPRAPPARSAL